jgi:CO/xanthine dehydrogenase FAD-binding subunit
MPVFRPECLDEAFEALERSPEAQLLAGGTDFMVEVNAGLRRPTSVLCLGGVAEIAGWHHDDGHVVLGAGLNYTEMLSPDLARLIPGLARAARTVGSPQIRNAGTIGGNLGTASPAGDTLPVLAALDADIVVGHAGGTRRTVPIGELIVGPKRTSLEPGEIILEVRVPAEFGRQDFLKVGTRNAMVIAVASVAVVVDWIGRGVRVALGSAGPVVIRANEAEALAASRIDWDERRLVDGEGGLDDFVALVRSAARPIDDHRSTAEYRRHAVGVCAKRALGRAFLTESRQEETWS